MANLAHATSVRRLSRGQMLFMEGDEATGFFVLLDGKVRIFKSSAEGREVIIRLAQSGEIFGEVAMFDGRQYPANCIAQADSVVLFCPRDAFLRLLAKSPAVGLKMIQALCSHLRIMSQLIDNLALKDVSARIAASLIERCRAGGGNIIKLDMTKSEWAKKLGTVGETLSRNLRKLSTAGVIRVERSAIRVLNPAALEMLARGEK